MSQLLGFVLHGMVNAAKRKACFQLPVKNKHLPLVGLDEAQKFCVSRLTLPLGRRVACCAALGSRSRRGGGRDGDETEQKSASTMEL
jgi:hypothetical protein